MPIAASTSGGEPKASVADLLVDEGNHRRVDGGHLVVGDHAPPRVATEQRRRRDSPCIAHESYCVRVRLAVRLVAGLEERGGMPPAWLTAVRGPQLRVVPDVVAARTSAPRSRLSRKPGLYPYTNTSASAGGAGGAPGAMGSVHSKSEQLYR